MRGTFRKIRQIQIQINPQTSIEPKQGAFYLKNKVSVHGLVLLVQVKQEPGWTWYIGHPIKFIMRKTILDHF